MGLLHRFTKGLNAAVEPVDRALDWSDTAMARAAEIEATGDDAVGRITGIRRGREDDSGERAPLLAVTVQAPDGTKERYGIEVGNHVLHRLRLGMDVLLRTDRGKAAFAWDAMCDRWGIDPGDPAQRSRRTAPDDGIEDKAMDWAVERRLKKGTPATATVVAVRQRRVMGMATENWEIDLRLADGSTASTKADEVPRYAAWCAAPGASVPVGLDPRDASSATIDWPAATLAAAPTVRVDDRPPEGSVAASIEAGWGRHGADTTAAASGDAAASAGPAADPDAPVVLDATLQSWVDTVRAGRMKAKQFEKAVADWQSAGMCTPAQADAARRAVT